MPVQAAANDISTFAGRPDAGDGGAATSAFVYDPADVAVGPGGEVYVVDRSNHRIRMISTAGTISTVAGNGTSGASGDGGPATSARLRYPAGIDVDAAGNLYIADTGNHRVRKVTAAGVISTLAGTGTAGFSGDGGLAVDAMLNRPTDVAVDGTGNVFVSDTANHRIRFVSTAGGIATVVGDGIGGYNGDGGSLPLTRVNAPAGIELSGSNLYIADRNNHRVRLISGGAISTIAGNGNAGYNGDNQTATSAQVTTPEGVAVDSAGNVYIADAGNQRIRRIVSGTIFTWAGTGVGGFAGDGGPATAALVDTPLGLALDGSDNLYLADNDNDRVRRVTAAGVISTVAGRSHFAGDGGPASDAQLNVPFGVSVDWSGNVYIADWGNRRVRRVSGGVMTTVAGNGSSGSSGDGGAATSASLTSPIDVAADPAGNVYIADFGGDRVRRVEPSGVISTFAGTGTDGFSGDGGPATLAALSGPAGLEVDAAGNVYIADLGNHRVRKVAPSGIITTVVGSATSGFCGDGGPATGACLDNPVDLAADADGALYVAEYGSHRIRMVDPSGVITTVAGNGTPSYSGDGGSATSAGVPFPTGLDVDGAGNILIASAFSAGGRIRKVEAGTITTVAGTGVMGFAGDGGPAVSAELTASARVALDAAGNFYIADTFNNRIRLVEALGELPAPELDGTTPASPANQNTVLVHGTAEPGTTVNIYTDPTCTGPAAASGTAADFASPGLSVTVADDTTTAFRATASDGSGNVSACSPDALLYVEDSAGPTVTIDSSPMSPGNDESPTWSFSAEAGSTTECELVRGSTVVSAFAPCTSPRTYDLSGEPDGDYTFRVRATDAAGNVGLSDTAFVGTVGTATCANTTSTITVPAGGVEAGNTLVVRVGLRDPASGVVGATDSAGNTYLVDANAATPQVRMVLLHSFVGAGLSGGDTITITHPSSGSSSVVAGEFSGVRASDEVDAIGTATGLGFTPNPSVTTTTERGLLYAGVTTFNQRGVTEAPGWTTHVHRTAGCGGSPGESTNHGARRVEDAGTFTYNPTISHSELWAAAVAAYRPAPYASSSFTLDGTLPAEPTITDRPADPTNDTTPTWTFTAEAGSTTECELVGVSPLAPCSSPVTYDLSGEPDGDYTFRVHARDGAGNVGPPASHTFTLDTADPATPTIDSAPTSPGNVTGPTWTFTVEPGATAECELSGVSAFAPCSSPATYDLSGEADGSYTFSVRAVDAAGNASGTATDTYELDTTAPDVTFTAEPSSPGNGRDPEWGFTTESGASLECELSDTGGVVSPYAPCTSPATFDLAGRPDGPHTLAVRATDAVGNLGEPATSTYVLDTTAPAVAFVSGPPAMSSDDTPTWTFTTEPGATTECELTAGPAVIDPYAPCSSPVTHDLTGEDDGPYTLHVRATDEAGNTGAPSSAGYTLDRVGPDVDITGEPTSPDTSRSPSWTFTTEPGATTECELLGPSGVVEPAAPCTSPVTYDLDGETDGDYTFSVRATDAAGNAGVPAGGVYTLDTAAPEAPTITAAPASPDNVTAPAWGFTAEPGASTECQLTREGAVVSGYASCASPRSYDVSVDGDYTFHVRATDPAGNTGEAATSDYTLDTTPPTVTFTSEPASPSSSRSPEWDFDTEAGASTDCRLSNSDGVVQDYAPCTAPATFDLTGLPDGGFTLDVRATDAVGNTGPSESSVYVLDTTAPEATIVGSPTSPANGRNPEWTFTAEPGATTECRLSDAGGIPGSWDPCTSPESYDLTGQPDGDYTFEVRATDEVGNTGPSDSDTYTLDTVPPAAPVLTSVPATPSNGTSPGWSFSAEAGTETECEFVLGPVVEPYSPCTSPQSLDLSGSPDGDYTIRVRAVDPAGNAGNPATHTYTLDTSGPAADIVGAPTSPGNSRTPTWSFTVESGAAAECELVGGSATQAWTACVSPIAFDLNGQPDATYTFRVRATDAAGSTGPVAFSVYALDTSGPIATILSGPAAIDSDRTPTWTFSTEPGATTQCELTGGSTVVSPLSVCASPRTYDLSADGDYTFRVRATDAAGNVGPFASASFTLQTPSSGGDGDGGGGGGGSGGSSGSGSGGSGGSGGGSTGGDAGGTVGEGGGVETEAPSSTTFVSPVTDPDDPVRDRRETADRDEDRSTEAREAPGAAPASPGEAPTSRDARPPGTLGRLVSGVGTVVEELLNEPGFPLTLLLLAMAFLVMQDRIDRRDPKLALAAVYPDPHVGFEPVPALGFTSTAE